jgi:prephenate dehydrogenase
LKIAIIGPGLIGRSVALAARRAQPDLEVVEVDRGEPVDRVSGASIVVLATPVDVILDSLRYFAEAFPDAIVLDTGSTKRSIVAVARGAGASNFVGGHPMAGAATAGPSHARADLFDDKPWFLVRGSAAAAAVDTAMHFVQRLGAAPVIFDDDGTEHDRVMAAVSHLPQLVASALMAVVGDAAGASGLRWAGTGLRDTTRLADSSASMWESIFASNETELRPLLLTMAEALRRMADHLDDADTVRRLFDVANHHRKQLG